MYSSSHLPRRLHTQQDCKHRPVKASSFLWSIILTRSHSARVERLLSQVSIYTVSQKKRQIWQAVVSTSMN